MMDGPHPRVGVSPGAGEAWQRPGQLLARVLVALAAAQALNLALVADEELRKVLSNLVQALVAALAAWLTVLAARSLRREGSPAAAGWSAIAVAMVLEGAGMVAFMVAEVGLGRAKPYPGVPDLLFLPMYPVMIAGLWWLPRDPLPPGRRWDIVLDVSALAVVASLFIWQFNLRLLIGSLATSPNAGTWTSLAYTFADALLLLTLFVLLVRRLGQGRLFVPMLLLVIGSFFLIAADLLQGYVTTYTSFTSGSPIDMGWVLFSTFCGLAAVDLLRPRDAAASDIGAGSRSELLRSAWTIAVTYLWIGATVVLLLWAVFHRDAFNVWLLAAGVVATTSLAITRQVRTLHENARLYGELQRSAVDLEAKVRERTLELEAQRARSVESEAFRRRVFEASRVPIVVMDATTLEYIDCNPAATEIYRFASREDTLGKTPCDVSTRRQADGTRSDIGLRDYVRRALVEGSVVFEWRHQRPDGEVWDAEVHLMSFRSSERPLLQFTLQDVTQRKRAEAALRESEERYRALFDRSLDCVFLADFQGRFLDANQAALDLLGYERGEITGLTYAALLSEDQLPLALEVGEALLTSGPRRQPSEFRLRRKDGGEVQVEVQSSLIMRDGRPIAVQGIARDITERRRVEGRIRQQAALLEASHDAIMVWDLSAGMQFMNAAAEQLTGWAATAARGCEVQQILRPRTDLALRAAMSELTSRGEWTGELELHTTAGPRTVASRWTALAEGPGAPASVLITCNDITEKKQLESQYLHAQRLESVGTLASGVAHDLNNILTPIVMGVELLAPAARDEESRGTLDMIQASAQRGIDTVRQLLTFARGGQSRRGPLQPRQLLEEITGLLRQTFPKSIQVCSECRGQPQAVLADASQIHQVLMNLCVNARDAMPGGGVLFLAVEGTPPGACPPLHPRARPIPYVVFRVSDSGTGIPAEVLDRIFDPFFTTKPHGMGTGLGLSTVLGIVEAHDGFVTVDSRPGEGTTFLVHLPAAGPRAELPRRVGSTARPRGDGELVLVVDDEDAVRRVAEGILQRHGYTTISAASASGALSLFDTHRDQIRAVLTDIMMPLGDGRQLVASLHGRDSRLPVVAMSGLGTGDLEREALDTGARVFLSKPFTADRLLSALRDAMDSVAA